MLNKSAAVRPSSGPAGRISRKSAKRNTQWKTIWIEYFGGDTYFRLCFPVRFLNSTLQKYILYLNIAI